MNAKYYFSVAALCLSMAACNSGKGGLTTGIDLANLDTTALPGTDFYQFACGGWMKNHPLTDEYSQYGSFTILAENNRKQMQGLIEELAKAEHEQGSVAQKIGTLYNLAMDSVKLNQEGIAPIKAELEEIAALKDKKDVYALLERDYKAGMLAKITGIFSKYGISIGEVIQKRRAEGDTVPLIFVTHDTQELSVRRAVEKLKECDDITKVDSVIRVVS